jgi:serine/threonine protein kinase
MHKHRVIHRDIKPENIVLIHVLLYVIKGICKDLRFRMVCILFQRFKINFLWDSFIFIAINIERKHV